MAPGDRVGAGAFFCDAHRRGDNVPIAPTAPYRRVRLTVEVLMGGASWMPSAAHLEAVARLERAVDAVGGWLDVKLVTSTIGCPSRAAVRRAPPVRPGGVNRS